MSNISNSDSLIIQQQKKQISISNSSSNKQKEEDIFELSNDQLSLSFQVQQQKKLAAIKYVVRDSKQDSLVFQIQEQMKNNSKIGQNRKRRQIFNKNTEQIPVKSKKIQEVLQGNLLNMFDQIFKIKSNQNNSNSLFNICGQNNFSNQQKLQYMQQNRTPSRQKKHRVKIFNKKQPQLDYSKILPADILDSESKELKNQQFVQNLKRQNQQLNILSSSDRLSVINQNLQMSRDSLQLNQILQAFNINQQQKRQENSPKKNIIKITKQQNNEAVTLPLSFKKTLSQNQPLQISIKTNKDMSNIPKLNNLQSSRKIQNSQPMSKFKPISIKNIQQQNLNQTKAPSVLSPNYQDDFKPQISTTNIQDFNFGEASSLKFVDNNNKNENLIKSQVKNIKKIVKLNNIFDKQQRLPIFLRNIRQNLSIYPNFYIFNNEQLNSAVRTQFQQLLLLLQNGTQLLSKICQKIIDNKSKIKLYLSQFSKNPNIQFYLSTNWNICDNFQQQNILIRPYQQIQIRQWNFQKSKIALTNYNNIISFYRNRNNIFNFKTQQGITKYYQIRQKLWDICGNLKLISQDLYCQMRSCKIPSHYQQFAFFLSSPSLYKVKTQRTKQLLRYKNKMNYLKKQGDFLLNIDQIWIKLKQKIEKQLIFHLPN